ncbi:hypothetical protein [Zhihengliuella halotolerans]|nr:hypothetical protein [Zhihengliuella halotolerans]
MSNPLTQGQTVFMYVNERLAVLEGAMSFPIGTRVEIGRQDYIVDNIRVGIRDIDFDIYYGCHLAESTGTKPPIR